MSPDFFNPAFSESVTNIMRQQFANPVRVEIMLDVPVDRVLTTVCDIAMIHPKAIPKRKRTGTTIEMTLAKQVVCWICKYICGYSYVQISEASGWNENTVASMTHFAQKYIDAKDTKIMNVLNPALKVLLYEA